MKTKDTQLYTRGTTLMEMLVYIGVLSIVTLALIFSITTLLGTLTQLKAREEIAHTGIVSLERIVREVRRAHAVNTVSSVFESNPGTLVLSTMDWSGSPSIVTITMQDGRVTIQNGAETPAPLSHDSVVVTDLTFSYMQNASSEGVLIELTAQREVRGETVSKTFRTFVIPREQ